ncbi:hypothetical protein [Vitiosangium sp. GDMCC 1.1324]|uniref:hypothetical protein n=1 Tax=Vitiosangium sp. (strain GDMCC 1.1324) TaxID=2138576 RepID=UPI00130ED66D|nr:hypothetical protein [Vitiosangium sp. GDMCC 1.1324]
MQLSARAGVLLVALLCGAGSASAQRPEFTWDVPRVLEAVAVPGVMRADGIPVRLRSVKSAEKPQVILQHLVDRFQAAGLYIPPDSHRTQWLAEPQLTALDTERLISYTFVLQPNPDGTTTVVLGEANLAEARQEQSAFAPVFPGGTDLMQSDLEGALAMTYVAEADPTKVRDFYLKELSAAGYAESESGTWRRRGEELRVGLRQAAPGKVVVIILRRTVVEDVLSPDVREGPTPAQRSKPAARSEAGKP